MISKLDARMNVMSDLRAAANRRANAEDFIQNAFGFARHDLEAY